MTDPQPLERLVTSDPTVDVLSALLRGEGPLYAEDLLEAEEGSSLPAIVGLHGYARSGKDTIAEWLVTHRGYTRLAFGDFVRAAALALNPWVPFAGSLTSGGAVFEGSAVHLADLVAFKGWEAAKVEHPEVRRLLQVLGTEVGRDLIDPDVWVTALLGAMEPGKRYVVSDVRFANEVAALRQEEAMLLFVVRPGFGPVNAHSSDAGLPADLFDFGLVNGHTIEALHNALAHVFPDPTGAEPEPVGDLKVYVVDADGGLS